MCRDVAAAVRDIIAVMVAGNVASADDRSAPLPRGLRFRHAAATSGFGALVTLGLTTATSLLVARGYGPAGYAVYVVASLLVFVGAVVAGFGLPLALARHIGGMRDSEALARLTTAAVLVGGASGLLVGALLAVSVRPIQHVFGLQVGALSAWVLPAVLVAAVLSDLSQSVFFGLLRPHTCLAITASGPAAMACYVLAARSAGLPLWGAIAVNTAVSGLVGVGLLAHHGLLRPRFHPSDIRIVSGGITSAAAYTAFTTFTGWADRFVVGVARGPQALGGYTSASLLVQGALRGPSQVGYLLIPAGRRSHVARSEAVAFEQGATDPLDARLLKVFALFAGATAVPLVTAAPELLRLVFGPGFEFAGSALQLLAPIAVVSSVSIPVVAALTASGQAARVPALLGGVLVPRFALLYLLTRWWGLRGTALGALGGEIVLAVAAIAVARRAGLTVPMRELSGSFALVGLVGAGGLALVGLGVPSLFAAALTTLPFILAGARHYLHVRSSA